MVVEEKDRRKFIDKLIKIFTIIHPDSENVELDDRYRKFLVECILLDLKGIEIGSTAARKSLEETLNISKSTVYEYRNELKKKGWISQDDYGYHYIRALVSKEFNLNFVMREDGFREADSKSGTKVL